VHAVDVGYGQFHPRLRADPRVVVHERVNARELRLPEPCSAPSREDLSFISLRAWWFRPWPQRCGPQTRGRACWSSRSSRRAGRRSASWRRARPRRTCRVVAEISSEFRPARVRASGSVESPLQGPAEMGSSASARTEFYAALRTGRQRTRLKCVCYDKSFAISRRSLQTAIPPIPEARTRAAGNSLEISATTRDVTTGSRTTQLCRPPPCPPRTAA